MSKASDKINQVVNRAGMCNPAMKNKAILIMDRHGLDVDNPSLTIDDIGKMALGFMDAETPCGCITEADGCCEHHVPAWPLIIGII